MTSHQREADKQAVMSESGTNPPADRLDNAQEATVLNEQLEKEVADCHRKMMKMASLLKRFMTENSNLKKELEKERLLSSRPERFCEIMRDKMKTAVLDRELKENGKEIATLQQLLYLSIMDEERWKVKLAEAAGTDGIGISGNETRPIGPRGKETGPPAEAVHRSGGRHGVKMRQRISNAELQRAYGVETGTDKEQGKGVNIRVKVEEKPGVQRRSSDVLARKPRPEGQKAKRRQKSRRQ